jgi:hypothetical protein
MNEKSLEILLRVLGKLRQVIATATSSEYSQDFGKFMADISSSPNDPGYIMDLIIRFPKWCKYYTKEALGSFFAYPFKDITPLQVTNLLNCRHHAYCQRILAGTEEMKNAFLARYNNMQSVAGFTTVAAFGVPKVHFISLQLVPSYLPNMAVFHAPYSATYLKKFLFFY